MQQLLIHDMAKAFAVQRHAKQQYGDEPYAVHLQAVENQVVKFSDQIPKSDVLTARAAAWLHDVIEDQGIKHYQLMALFGCDIADLVWQVTDEKGMSRSARHVLTYAKIREYPLAVFLKLCDRIANVEAGGKVEMYAQEHAYFKSILYTPGRYEKMWAHLDSLLEPQHA